MQIRLVSLAALSLTDVAVAHHSLAMFDPEKRVTLQGTVREFQWTNPHCFIQLLVPSPDGLVEWSVEMHSPAGSMRQGWRRNSLQPGDALTVVIKPLRDGSHGGLLVLASDTNGKPLHTPPVQP